MDGMDVVYDKSISGDNLYCSNYNNFGNFIYQLNSVYDMTMEE